MTYAEYLKANGASAEEIAILDTPAGRRTFEKMQGDLDAANAARTTALEDAKNMRDWYNDKAVPEYTAKNNEVIAAKAEAAKFRNALRTAKDQGLVDLTDDFFGPDGNTTATVTPVTPTNQNRDYFTKEEVAGIADQEGEAIAMAQDIAFEHQQLFPGQPINMRALRQRAKAARKSVSQQWEDEFKVPDARKAREQKAREDEQKKWREEGAKAERERLAQEYNPDTRAPIASNSPFAIRKTANDVRSKQPWETSGDLSDERVVRVARKIISGGTNSGVQ